VHTHTHNIIHYNTLYNILYTQRQPHMSVFMHTYDMVHYNMTHTITYHTHIHTHMHSNITYTQWRHTSRCAYFSTPCQRQQKSNSASRLDTPAPIRPSLPKVPARKPLIWSMSRPPLWTPAPAAPLPHAPRRPRDVAYQGSSILSLFQLLPPVWARGRNYAGRGAWERGRGRTWVEYLRGGRPRLERWRRLEVGALMC
jgi:hypothetical protein